MARPTSEDRREDYLAIGMEILMTFTSDQAALATVDALADVRISDIAERAGVTKGAIYHVWPSQEAYRKDLLARILEQNNQTGIRMLGDLIETATASGQNPRELMYGAADAAFETMRDDPVFFARFSFFIYASNPEVRELMESGDREVVKQFGTVIDTYLDLTGRRVREPFSTTMIVTAASALLTGLCLRYRTSPDLVDASRIPGADANGPGGLFAVGLDSIMHHFSEPIRSLG